MTTRWWISLVMFGTMGCASAAATEPSRSAETSAREGVEPAPPSEAAAADGFTVAVPETVDAWRAPILDAATRHGVEPDLVALVVWQESNGQADARSSAGALGLMQMMPATAAAVARRLGHAPPSDAELLEPERNLDLGCAHLAELSAQWATDGLDADAVHRIGIAYNGGGRVLEAWLRGESLPPETERYAATLRERWETRSQP